MLNLTCLQYAERECKKSGHKEWRGHPYALNLRSAREKLELLPDI